MLFARGVSTNAAYTEQRTGSNTPARQPAFRRHAGASNMRASICMRRCAGHKIIRAAKRTAVVRIAATALADRTAGAGTGSAKSKWIRTSLVRTDPQYEQTKFEVDFLPPSVGAGETGVVLFCHGFEQVPQDYDTVLQRLAADGHWVVAPVQPQYVPKDPVLKLLGGSREVLQGIVHADACQVAGLLFGKGADDKPKLNEVGGGVALPDLSGKQVAIAGHSLGGGLTWSVVQQFPGRFDKLAVMAPFPNMASDALTPATVIGKPDPATGKPFQPPGASLIIDGGLDVLALAFRINQNIVKPLGALQPLPNYTTFEFTFGTHTGYQDFTGIGNVLKFPAGVLITIPEQRVAALQSAVGGDEERKPRAELILGAAGSTKVVTLPSALENAILQAVSINKYAIYFVLLAALLAISRATGALGDLGGPLAPLFGLLSIVTFLLVPLTLFEVFYYTPFVQRPQTADKIGDFLK